ncbi:hypothetical protein AALO_G00232170 [Alosa alosa]|uniref:Uncharacterized protein n=1 Tax=Alosa alosa TaxID=278164 RepID=A0AAV6FUK5_9TELE|nr:uncharacterized protein LOC125311484 [Alosa alosa]KAG5266445.1 hypothetical protein AALO_G00232170 [Alosa alosa]
MQLSHDQFWACTNRSTGRLTTIGEKVEMVKTNATTFLSWTDDEVELLLKVTLEYKVTMAAEGIKWELSCSKYGDILQSFLENYPTHEAGLTMRKEFPHKKQDITKAQLTSKLKAIRNKYRQAVKTGRKSGHGRVILLYFELCEAIWEESLGTDTISGVIETSNTRPETPTASSAATGEESLTEETIDNCRQQLNRSLGGCRRSKLMKRPFPDAALEDLRIKRRLLHQLEATHNEFVNSIGRLSSSVDRLNSNIELLVQHIVGTGNNNTEDLGHPVADSVNIPVDQPSVPGRIKAEFHEVALDSSPALCQGSPKLRIKSEQVKVEEDGTETMVCSTQTNTDDTLIQL